MVCRCVVVMGVVVYGADHCSMDCIVDKCTDDHCMSFHA